MSDLAVLTARVSTIPDPSKAVLRYRDALLHAAEMRALPAYIVDREERIKNTLGWARYRLSKLSAEDRARVEAVEGAIG